MVTLCPLRTAETLRVRVFGTASEKTVFPFGVLFRIDS